jgi:hypothetical protein
MWVIVFTGAFGRYIFPPSRAKASQRKLKSSAKEGRPIDLHEPAGFAERSLLLWRWAHIIMTVALVFVAAAHIVTAMLFKVT